MKEDLAYVDLEHQERALRTEQSEKIVNEHRLELDTVRAQVQSVFAISDFLRVGLDNLNTN